MFRMRAFLGATLAVLGGALFASPALAQTPPQVTRAITFNEININPPGTDNGQEFIEFQGAAGASVAGLTLLVLEGDPGTANPGQVDIAITYPAGTAIGSNGLLLHRDGTTVLDADGDTAGVQGPDPATTVYVQDFNPDIENGSNTYLLVRLKPGQTVARGDDFDSNDDGVIDAAAFDKFDVVFDAVSYTAEENRMPVGVLYAGEFGGTEITNTVFTPDYFVVIGGRAHIIDGANSTNNGPYRFDLFEQQRADGAITAFDGYLTPGRPNTTPPRIMIYGRLFLQALPALPTNLSVELVLRPAGGGTDIVQTVNVAEFLSSTTSGNSGNFRLGENPSGGLPAITVPTGNYTILFRNLKNTLGTPETGDDTPFLGFLSRAVSLTGAQGVLATFNNTDVNGDGMISDLDIVPVLQPVLLAGDLNGDNTVDFSDFEIFLSTFGLNAGDSGYNVIADFNRDNTVDFSDFEIFLNTFGLNGDQ